MAGPLDDISPAAIAQNNLKREMERRASNDVAVMAELLSARNSRAWLYRKLAFCNIYGPTFFFEKTHRTSFALGQENVGKMLLNQAQQADGAGYLLMIQEANADALHLQTLEQNVNDPGDPAPPRAEDQMPYINPPPGYPGHVPPE